MTAEEEEELVRLAKITPCKAGEPLEALLAFIALALFV